MSSIDQRIVDMQFNNKQFESGIKESLDSLSNLKKGLGGLGERNLGLSGIASGINEITDRFSNLGIIGITVLQNLTNRAIDAGVRIAKSLSIEPIMEGYADYERKITSVQTIMNATGESIKVVSGYFDQLDEYADLTIYNLDDMTSAFAKFTNAGVDMDKSVPAIKGVANMVALAGQDANAASIAMYNLSQSIAGGFLTTMDYKSLNLANVATKEWKNQMIQGAIAAGSLKQNTEGMYNVPGVKTAYTEQQLFTEALSKGWATTEVLLNVLGDYGDTTTEIGAKAQAAAQDVKSFSMMMETLSASVGTSWTDTFEIVIGDLEESKKLFTDLTNVLSGVLDSFAESRNEMLKTWKDLGGRQDLIEGISNAFKGLSSILSPIREAFSNIFPPITGQQLADLTESFKMFSERLTISEQTSENLKRTFSGLFAVIDIVRMALGTLLDVAGNIVGIFVPMSGSILELTARLGDFLVSIRDTAKETNFFGNISEQVKNVLTDVESTLRTIGDSIREAISRIGEHFKGFEGIDLSGLKNFSLDVEFAFKPFEAIANVFKKAIEVIAGVFEWALPIILPIASKIGEAIGKFADEIASLLTNGDFKGALDLLNTGLLGAVIFGIKKFIDSLTEVTSGASGFLGGITGIIDGVGDSLSAFSGKLKADALMSIAIAIGILAASLLVLSKIPAEQLMTSIAGITVLFAELSVSLSILSTTLGPIKLNIISGNLILLSSAILILSVAMKSLSELSWEELAKGMVAITALSAVLVITATVMSQNAGKITTGSLSLIAMATALLILTEAVENLSKLNIEELAKGLGAIGVILVEIAAFTQLVNPTKLVSTGIAMIAIGAALLILTEAVENLSKLNIEELAKGLGAVGVVLIEIAGFSKLVNPAKLVSTGIAMIAIGAALLILVESIKRLSGLNMEELAKGLGAIGVVLIEIAGFSKLVNPAKLVSTGVAMIAIGAALLIISQAVMTFSGLSWEELAKGLLALGGSLAIIAIGVNAMSGALPGAAALLIVSGALMVLAPALMMLGSMELSEIGIALLALAGVFVIVGASAIVLAPLTPVIIGLAAGIALLGVGVLSIGAGLLAFSAGLTALAVAGTAGVAALVVLVTTMAGLIPMVATKLAEGVITFAKTITAGMPAIMDAIRAVATGLIEIIGEVTPDVAAAMIKLVQSLLKELSNAVPDMVKSGMKILLGFLQGIEENIQDITTTSLKIMANLLKGIADGIPGVVTSGVDVIVAFLGAIGGESQRVIDAGFQLIIDFLNGLAAAIEENTDPLIDAMANVGDAMIEGIGKGLTRGISSITTTVSNIGTSALDSLRNAVDSHSPSREFEKIGVDSITGYNIGLSKMENRTRFLLKEFGSSIKKTTSEALNIKGGSSKDFEKLGGITYDSLCEGIQSAVDKQDAKLKETGGITYDSLVEGIQNAVDKQDAKLKEAGGITYNSLVEGLNNAVAKQDKKIEDAGGITYTSLVDGLNKAVANQDAKLKESGGITYDSLVEGIQNAVDKQDAKLKEAGRKTVKSINAGIADTSNMTEEEIKKLADAAIAASYEALDFSWALNELGVKNSEGFLSGLYSMTDSIRETMKNMFVLDEETLDAMTTNMDEALTTIEDRLSSYTDIASNRFGQLSTDSSITVADMITNLKQNQIAMTEWADNIAGLAYRGLDEGLLEELRQAGPASAGEVKALLAATDAELKELSSVMGNAGNAAVTALVASIPEGTPLLIEEGQTLIEALSQGMADSESMNEAMALLIDTAWKHGLDPSLFTTVGIENIEAMVDGLEAALPEVVSTAQDVNAQSIDELKASESEYRAAGEDDMLAVNKGMKDREQDVVATTRTTAQKAVGEFASFIDKFYKVGQDAIGGFIEGMRSKLEEAGRMAAEIALAAMDAAMNALDEGSPSKEFFKIGMYAVMGFANGMEEYSYLSENEAELMANTAIENVRDALASISDISNYDLDMTPTIRPVIDMTDVDRGVKDISDILGQRHELNLSALLDISNGVAKTMKKDDRSIYVSRGDTKTKQTPSISLTQNNYSPKALSRVDIYRQTKNQFATLKGLVEI